VGLNPAQSGLLSLSSPTDSAIETWQRLAVSDPAIPESNILIGCRPIFDRLALK
jgi:hypothetical protein